MLEKNPNEFMCEITRAVVEEVAKDVYNDAGKPIVKPSGELVGLVPRAIKAALAPLEQWILQKEYNVAETKKLLEKKLENISPELIEPPEPHIAVPAMQYISYCMDNDELRDMYANLLANSMNKVVKNGVHPGFVEIIKQLCPDEAKFLKYMSVHYSAPTLGLRYVNENGVGIEIFHDFTLVPKLAGCENENGSDVYIDNLARLGLLKRSQVLSYIADKNVYEPLKQSDYVIPHATDFNAKQSGYEEMEFVEGYIELTSYGESFCDICLDTTESFLLEFYD